MMNCKGSGRDLPWPEILPQHPTRGTEEKLLNTLVSCKGRVSNRIPPEYKTRPLPLHQSVWLSSVSFLFDRM